MNKKKYLLILASFCYIFMSLKSYSQQSLDDEFEQMDQFDPSKPHKNQTSQSKSKKSQPLNKQSDLINEDSLFLETKSPNDEIQNSKSLTKIEILFQEKKYKEIIDSLSPIIDKANSKEMTILSKAYLELNNFEQALQIVTILLSKNQKSFEGYTLQGQAHWGKYLNNPVKKELSKLALESFQKSLELNIRYEPAYWGIEQIYLKNKNNYELRLLYQDMIKAIGNKASFYKKLCDLNVQDGVNDQAIKYCSAGQSINPDDPSYLVNIGTVYNQQGEVNKAEKIFKKAIKKYPKSEIAHLQFAIFLENQKNYIDAYKEYLIAKNLDPTNGRSWVGIAETAYILLKYAESIDAFSTACKIDKKYAVQARKANIHIRINKINDWTEKFQSMADKCSEK